tara:strand:+ start:1396 stop:1521 length:126 start_codon:yes stop_codon:yes gene_type:complete
MKFTKGNNLSTGRPIGSKNTRAHYVQGKANPMILVPKKIKK